MNIVFFGTSTVGIPTLEIIKSTGHLKAIVTTPDTLIGRRQVLTPSAISQHANGWDIPILKPKNAKQNQKLIDQLREFSPDLFIVVSYGKILPIELIELPPHKTLNIHFSLLPKYRGAAPIQWALAAGETVTGSTIFVLDEKIDHGSIVAQLTENVQPNDTFTTLAMRLADLSAELLMKILEPYVNGSLPSQPQDHSRATNAPIIKKNDGLIDWNWSAEQIYNRWRAFIEWPGIWTYYNNGIFKIISCFPAHEKSNEPIGTILQNGNVVCGNKTTLELKIIQPAGKKQMGINDFLRGNPDAIGLKLGSTD